ncbi:hypothetical protein PPS11_01799 [Pseudomonas putida S11]|nr:hypothetical protein PPS11_01799 [Pseudomonas putida S11]
MFAKPQRGQLYHSAFSGQQNSGGRSLKSDLIFRVHLWFSFNAALVLSENDDNTSTSAAEINDLECSLKTA